MMEWQKEANELRQTYSDLLIEYGRQDERICVVEADLMASASTQRFKQIFPDRLINVGVAEADMIGVAAGLSAMGKIPFTHTFSAFASRRCCDQVTISVAYAKQNVKMVGSDPGVSAELNGGTHMSFEDVSIMRNIPGMVIFEPVDSIQFRKVFPQIVEHYGPVYIRLFRKNAWSIFDSQEAFRLGTLENVCRGNRSECARRMGMEYAELRRVRKRMSEGSVSSRATEALLEMYWREGLSVDEVLRQYTRSQFGADLEAVEQVCSELVKELRESLQDQGRNTHRSAHLMKTAYQFVGQVQRCFCDELCQRSRYQDTPCPAKRLMDFLSWLEQERKTLTAGDESAREETMEVVEEETCSG